MSVLVKGMEMPTSCAFCRFCEGLADTLRGTCAFCSVDGKYRDAQTNDGCPLVPVPPHGRLIDADALNYTMLYKENWMSGTGVESPAVWRKDIEDAPTIIPADHIGDVNEMVTDKEGEG